MVGWRDGRLGVGAGRRSNRERDGLVQLNLGVVETRTDWEVLLPWWFLPNRESDGLDGMRWVDWQTCRLIADNERGSQTVRRKDGSCVGWGGICCSAVVLCVCVCVRVLVSYREVVLCCQKVGGRFERSTPPFRFTCWKGVGPLGPRAGQTQEIPGPPSSPRWYPNRISHPLHAGGSERALSGCFCHCLLVSQCVSLCQMLARKPIFTPAAKPRSGFPPASARPAFNCLSLHPRFVKPIRPSGPPWRITQSA